MTDDIKPRIVDGEPVCSVYSENECPCYFATASTCVALGIPGTAVDSKTPCIPGIRRQRDEALRALDDSELRRLYGLRNDDGRCRCQLVPIDAPAPTLDAIIDGCGRPKPWRHEIEAEWIGTRQPRDPAAVSDDSDETDERGEPK